MLPDIESMPGSPTKGDIRDDSSAFSSFSALTSSSNYSAYVATRHEQRGKATTFRSPWLFHDSPDSWCVESGSPGKGSSGPSFHRNESFEHFFKEFREGDHVPIENKCCGHRTLLTKCKHRLCQDAAQKLKWLEYTRDQCTLAQELILKFDKEWRDKLYDSLALALGTLRATYKREVSGLKITTNRKSSAHHRMEQTLEYLETVQHDIRKERPGLNLSEQDYITYHMGQGLTTEHQEYLKRIIHVSTSNVLYRYNGSSNHRKTTYKDDHTRLYEGVQAPIAFLDRIRESKSDIVNKALLKVEKSFHHSITLASSSERGKASFTMRVKDNLEQASQLAYLSLRSSLNAVEQTVASLPALYAEIDLRDYHQALRRLAGICSNGRLMRPDSCRPFVPRADGSILDHTSKKENLRRKTEGDAGELGPSVDTWRNKNAYGSFF